MTAGSRHGDPPVGRHRRRVRSRWSDRRAGAFQTGWTVLILERGQKAPVAGSMAQTFRELRMPGRSLLLTDRPLAVLRGVTVGGSSIYFFGTPWEPPYELFDKRGVDIHAEVAAARRTAPGGSCTARSSWGTTGSTGSRCRSTSTRTAPRSSAPWAALARPDSA